jgi:DmsE family decaheme c-type cytochrome
VLLETYRSGQVRGRSPAHSTYVCRLWFALLALACLTLSACGFVMPDGRRLDAYLGPGWPKPDNAFRETCLPPLHAELPVIKDAEYVDADEECANCHESLVESFKQNVHHGIRKGESCEACHGPCSEHVDSGGEKPGLVWSFQSLSAAQRSEICARCHEDDACGAGAQWRTSVHAHRGLSCLDCHTAHYERQDKKSKQADESEKKPAADSPQGVPAKLVSDEKPRESKPDAPAVPSNNLGAISPDACYRCHADMADLQRIAGPHQIGGPNGFNCTTCHDAHGKIVEASREEMCLTCHEDHSPTMAWHSSTHGIAGVACTDCHNPHPRSNVPLQAEIEHASVRRPQRRAMSVQEPEACYKCHPQMYALSNLPSHHPIQEGKMRCSDCHDAHGEADKGLREPTVNLVCYRCHAEKQGPFAYEHSPVTEDCGICHEPHGTVTNNLLRQPATFLCLRCHSGHRSDHRQLDDPANTTMRQALYTDCTQCHSQVHGSDLIGESLLGSGLTR